MGYHLIFNCLSKVINDDLAQGSIKSFIIAYIFHAFVAWTTLKLHMKNIFLEIDHRSGAGYTKM